MSMVTALLILHGLVGVALLGAITHQLVSVLRRRTTRNGTFLDRYTGVTQMTFTTAVVSLYVAGLVLGAVIYPSYRLDVRIPFEEMSLKWAIGLFELKEHFAGIGLAVLPVYVWWDFLVGHILNNIRGLG
jgi:hypothetical protein